MGLIQKIGKAKAKFSAWNEEREQKAYNKLKTEHKLSVEYNKRAKEKKEMEKEISKAKKTRFENSFIGKISSNFGNLDEPTTKKRSSKHKKKSLKFKRDDYDMFGDGDPWA